MTTAAAINSNTNTVTSEVPGGALNPQRPHHYIRGPPNLWHLIILIIIIRYYSKVSMNKSRSIIF